MLSALLLLSLPSCSGWGCVGVAVLSFVLSLSLCAFVVHRRYWHVAPELRSIPHLQPEFLVGSTRQMGLLSGKTIAEGMLALREKLGGPPIMQGRHHFVVLHSPELVKALFANHKLFLGSNPFLNSLTLAIFPEGSLPNFDGEEHRKLTSILVPTVRRRRIGVWVPVMTAKADLVVELWARRAQNLQAQRAASEDGASDSSSSPSSSFCLPSYRSLVDDYGLYVEDVLGNVILGSDLLSVNEAVLAEHRVATELQSSLPTRARFEVPALSPDLVELSSHKTERDSAAQLVLACLRINDAFGGMFSSPFLPWISKILLRLNRPYQRARKLLAKRVETLFEVCEKVQARKEDQEEWNRNQTGTGSTVLDAASPEPSPASSASPMVPLSVPSDVGSLPLTPHLRDTAVFAFAKGVERGLVSRTRALENLFGLQAAAGDTSISTLCWISYFLAKHPHVQEKCREELREKGLMPERPDVPVSELPEITSEIMEELHYHEAVIKETFRAGVVSVGSFRVASEDTDALGGVRLRKGQQIMWSSTFIHKDGDQWSGNPRAFEPRRFVEQPGSEDASASPPSCPFPPGSDQSHHAYAFLPFGGGVHGCPGRHLAWLMLKTMLVRCMQRGVTFEDTPENQWALLHKMAIFPKELAPNVKGTWTQ